MKIKLISALLVLISGCSIDAGVNANETLSASSTKRHTVLNKEKWIHGSVDCKTNQDPSVDIYRHDETSFILRQNKCLTFEAPFVYVLVGERKILVFDTGAMPDTDGFSLYQEIKTAVGADVISERDILVIHSHGHSDHYQGDGQFDGQPNVTLVGPTAKEMKNYFGFNEWPTGQSTVDLGNRKLTVIPTPGHQEESITVYDHQNKWLLTGDTLYPGIIYIKNWDEYKLSIDRLNKFSKSHKINAILGAHIEMAANPGEFYQMGSTYQPNEAQLDLATPHLHKLNAALQRSSKAEKIDFDEFKIQPMGLLQKSISNVVRWFTQ
ncbi:beta-lactamase-like protein [Paraglaciecola sp. T6c]|uniref:MBL fold metallo-hydrolase n=1 Tax=Pseudoalteromonas atlantica (strain T6c / ATCC BAA-1087) TaxID=3042615 RepID=UPI00005C59F4|nr:MBL fold metallo-hydrolase [Paraglaciecola sp. T6c]ABG40018.1 beta-lactamase-like protein [Paraglaciecola sp. T6c]